jgi:hypothetical protein
MRMRRLATSSFVGPLPGVTAGLVTLLAACALGTSGSFPASSDARIAMDVPVRFEPASPAARLTPADTIAGEGCRNPMIDPRQGQRLTIVRSLGGEGDYRVPRGSYGVETGERLRIECNTGAVVGIVVA